MVWGVVTNEDPDVVRRFSESLGVTFPVLVDETGEVSFDYDQVFPFPTGAYPRDYVIGTDGRIVYANNEPDVEAIEQAVSDALTP